MNNTSKLTKTTRGKAASVPAREQKAPARKGAAAGRSPAKKKAGPGRPAAKKTRAGKLSASRTAAVQARTPQPRKTVSLQKKALKLAGLTHESPVMMASGVVNAVSSLTLGRRAVQQPQVRLTRRKTARPRLLWIGDALVPTGFATVTHAVLDHLRRDWDVVVSGVNYDGAKHRLPYQVLPAWQGGDMWGMNRFRHLCAEFDPAAVIINNDWWNVAQFAQIAPAGVPVIGYMPVDGGNLDPAAMRQLNKLHAAVWYTDYGHREAAKAGFTGRRHVIPHGIDTTVFHPMNRDEARRILDLNVPKKAFIVGNLNRNQPRKRLDVTIEIFAGWIRRHAVSNAFLLLHCAEKDTGWDLRRAAAFHGVADRLLLTGSDDMRGLQSPRHLNLIYNSLDVQMTTTLGEGWGLTTMEGMACGIPQVVPDSSALAEWALPAVKIPCSRLLLNPQINTTGALVDHEPFVAALQDLYRDKAARARLSAQGIAHVRRDEFGWRGIARQFHALVPAPVPVPASSATRARRPQHA
ncbi:MAG: glycosyltransferase [Prosthecobacter sp.]